MTQREDLVAQLAAAGFSDAVEVARGGYAAVYRCRQAALDRVVAVKVLTVYHDDHGARFDREQQAMARLTGHPNIVAVLQIGRTEQGCPFFVMPWCGAGSLQERIAGSGRLSVAEALHTGVKIAGALASAHRLAIVHRDVKPSNILVTDYGQPALADFGIAHVSDGFVTASGVFTGSPAFTAPEIVSGDGPSAASDVYGLGATMFAGLTGHAAFERRQGERVVAQFVRITNDPLPDLRESDIPGDVAALIEQTMSREPGERPTALQLGRRLQELQAVHGLPVDDMAVPDVGAAERSGDWPVPPLSASRSASRSARRVPAVRSAVVGRDPELAELHRLVTQSRLVTVTGTGGVGKTTLVTAAAARLDADFPDGVWMVELADLREAELLTEFVACALEVRDQPGRAVMDVLVDFLCARHALLVLDNCEHVVDTAATLIDTLLRQCPQLHILATSREVLDIGGETLLRLGPLSYPTVHDDPTLSGLGAYEAVNLFAQLASAAVPGFRLDRHNATAIARCCARLDGLPLAIELAAARMRVMSADQIAEELSDRFGLLTGGHRGAPVRRQSLAKCVEWSYDLCAEPEQRLWCRLSVFAESFDLATARGVCGDDVAAGDFLGLLCALVDKSILIRAEHQGAVTFRLLETLREYGNERISEAERLHVRQRHVRWYHRLLCDAETDWYGPSQLQWVQRLDREMPNIREALDFALSDCPAMAVDMIAALRRYWVYHATLSEGCQWAGRTLAAIPGEPGVPRIRSLFAAAHLALRRGDDGSAATWLAEACELLDVVDEPVTRGMITFSRGYYALITGDIVGGRDWLHQAMAATDDFEVQANSMSALGWLELISGDAQGALTWAEKGLALAESRGDWATRAVAMGSVATAAWRLGDPQRAADMYRRGLQLALEVGDQFAVANGLEILAWFAESCNCPRYAAVLMAAAAGISRASGSPLATAVIGGLHNDCQRRTIEQLGTDEFQTAWNEGAALDTADIAREIGPVFDVLNSAQPQR